MPGSGKWPSEKGESLKVLHAHMYLCVLIWVDLRFSICTLRSDVYSDVYCTAIVLVTVCCYDRFLTASGVV